MDIDSKTTLLLEKLVYCDLRTSVDIDKAKQHIRKALLEQDKDSRNACIEALLECPCACVNPIGMGGILFEDAHKAIMNTKAV